LDSLKGPGRCGGGGGSRRGRVVGKWEARRDGTTVSLYLADEEEVDGGEEIEFYILFYLSVIAVSRGLFNSNHRPRSWAWLSLPGHYFHFERAVITFLFHLFILFYFPVRSTLVTNSRKENVSLRLLPPPRPFSSSSQRWR